MFDYKGILTNITGFAKTTFQSSRRGDANSTTSSELTTSSDSSSSSRKSRRSARDLFRRQTRLSSSEEARNTAVIASEAREDGIYSDEDGTTSPYNICVQAYDIGDMRVEKTVELAKKPKVEKKKKSSRELNIPQRDMFAHDFVLRPDEDLPGFTPIDSEYETDDEVFEAEELNRRPAPRYVNSMPPPLCGLNPDIPNEYDAVIGIIAVHGVRIPRSKPIDIKPPSEPLFPFFDVSTDLHVMLITERMYDVFKENVREKGKPRILGEMEDLAVTLTVGQMCRRLLPVELMDKVVYFYDYDTVTFLSRAELIHILAFCESHDNVASSTPSMFYREKPKEIFERNYFFQKLMDMQKIFCRRTDYVCTSVDEMDFEFPFIDTVDNEHNKRVTIERQLKDENMDHEEVGRLIRTISQDLEEAERQQGIDFIHKSTLSLFDARVMIPIVN